ncbi:MAG: hypothetical protein RJA70_5021, partial [Pseudomonadota bacterium]
MSSRAQSTLVLSCEHGGNRVPAPYRALFSARDAQQALDSHRGYDIGALPLARSLAVALNAPLTFSEVSRLLVDLNRSVGRPGLHSEFANGLNAATKEAVLGEYYYPHRAQVRKHIAEALSAHSQVVH